MSMTLIVLHHRLVILSDSSPVQSSRSSAPTA